MAKLSELKVNDLIKVLIYGHSGAGKSCAASTFPTPIFYADFDGKVTSVARFQQGDSARLGAIDFEDFRFSAGDKVNSYSKFLAYLARLEELSTTPEKFPFKTFVVDSLTTLSDAMIAYLLKKHSNIHRAIPNVPGQQDWGIILNEMKDVVKRVLALPCNVIFIGHIKDTKDEITGAVEYKVALAGQAADALPILMEEVYRAYVENDKDGNVKYLAQTRATSKYKVRTQIPGMPPVIHLSYQGIKAAMEGKYPAQTKENKS
jgi:hypothetical protein